MALLEAPGRHLSSGGCAQLQAQLHTLTCQPLAQTYLDDIVC